MSHHEGECPVCKKSFGPGDDVVICPICGAPYHRECYVKEGQCVFTDRHKSGFEYTPPRPAAGYRPAPGTEGGATAGGQASGVLCKNCSTVNDARNIFCEQCGAPLHQSAAAGSTFGGTPGGQQNQQGSQGQQGYQGYQGPNYGGSPFGAFGAGAQPQVDMTGEVDGIPKRDWAAFIGPSAPVYIARMAQQDERKSKIGPIFTAFFFPGCFFAFRKMWGWALLALAIWLLVQAPGTLTILLEAGSISLPGLRMETLATLSQVAPYVNIARLIAFGLFGLTLYRRSAAKTIHGLQQASDGDTAYQAALQRKGAPTVIGPIAVFVLIFIFFFIFWYVIGGDAMVTYLLQLYGASA